MNAHDWTAPSPEQLLNARESADIMTKAADLIEKHLDGTTPGSWAGYLTDHAGEVFAGPWQDGYRTGSVMSWCEETLTEYGGQPSQADLAWLCLMHPLIGPPLVALLRDGATEAMEIGPNWRLTEVARALFSDGPWVDES
jgi:hypothetical protein